MPDEVRTAQYFKLTVADRPGEAARVLAALRSAGVNLHAYLGFPRRRRSQLDFVPADPAAFKRAAKAGGWKVEGPKKCFLIAGEDRVGALADALDKLAAAKLNLTASGAIVAGGGRYGAILWVDSRSVTRAARILGAR